MAERGRRDQMGVEGVVALVREEEGEEEGGFDED